MATAMLERGASVMLSASATSPIDAQIGLLPRLRGRNQHLPVTRSARLTTRAA